MKPILAQLGIVLACLQMAPAFASDNIVKVPLADVLAMPEAQSRLDGTVKFFLAGQATPANLTRMGSDVSNPKTNALNKTAQEACKWVILTGLERFQKSAEEQGANAVVDIVSFYKSVTVKSDTTIDCHSGFALAGAALKGTYAKIGK